jgi:hypothetical protein
MPIYAKVIVKVLNCMRKGKLLLKCKLPENGDTSKKNVAYVCDINNEDQICIVKAFGISNECCRQSGGGGGRSGKGREICRRITGRRERRYG